MQHRLDPAKRELTWGASPSAPFEYVAAHLRETDRYGTRQADRNLSRKRMLDPVARDGLMSNLLMDVLRQRWYQVGDVIKRGIEELEQQEEGHAQSQPTGK